MAGHAQPYADCDGYDPNSGFWTAARLEAVACRPAAASSGVGGRKSDQYTCQQPPGSHRGSSVLFTHAPA